MSYLFLFLLVLTGFVAALLARLSAQDRFRSRSRLAIALLLIATLWVLGWVAAVLDRRLFPPRSWTFCGACILLGVGICSQIYFRQRFRFAIVAGAVMVATILVLHFSRPSLIVASQKACAAVREGMDPDQVSAAIISHFYDGSDYAAVVSSKRILTNEEAMMKNERGQIVFDLRPQWIQLERGSIMVDFHGERAVGLKATALQVPSLFLCFQVGGAIILCVLCLFGPAPRDAERESPASRELAALSDRIRVVREQAHGGLATCNPGALYRKGLLNYARTRLQNFTFFGDRGTQSHVEEEER